MLTFADLILSGLIAMIAFLHTSRFCARFASSWCCFKSAPHSVRPPQSRPSSRSLPSHLHCCYLLCNVRVFSSHHMAIHERRFWVTYVVIGLTIALLLKCSFLIRSFLFCPESISAFHLGCVHPLLLCSL